MFLYILRAAVHVVRLDGQHFLQRVRGAVGLERPHFHFAEALAAELRLAAQRLLRDQAVRAGRTRVHLVVDQVVQLQHVHVADGHRRARSARRCGRRTGASDRSAAVGERSMLDLFLGRAVEHRRRHRHAVPTGCRRARSLRRSANRCLPSGRRSCCRSDRGTRAVAIAGLRVEHAADLAAEALARPSRDGSRGSARCSCARARPADSARCRPAYRPRGTACPRPERSSR